MRKTIIFIKNIPMRLTLLIFSGIMLLPFFWIFSTSLRDPVESFRLPPSFFPTEFMFSNYVRVFQGVPFANFIFNSTFVATTAVFLQVIITSMAAYVFARLEFRGQRILFIIILTGIMIPGAATMVPVFMIINTLGLIDNLWALILPALINPFGIFLVRQFMRTIPKSYDESALMDGAGRFRIYWSIILPMAVPSIMVVVMLSFIAIWNDFMGPLIYINTFERMTLALGINVLRGFMGMGNMSVLLAGIMLTLVVPTLLFVFGQKYFMQGVIISGLKS